MLRMSAKVVLCNSVILDMSDSFLLIMFLYLGPMLLLVVSWITVTHFSGVSLSSIFVNYSASKTVQLESYQIPVDTLRNCIGFQLNIAQSLKQPPLFISFSTLVFPSILLHISLHTVVPTVPVTVRVVVISLSFPSFNPQSKNLSNSLAIVLLLMLPLFGMLFLRRFVHPPLLPPSEYASKPTFTPRHTPP